MSGSNDIPQSIWKKMWSMQEKILHARSKEEIVTTFYKELKKIVPHRLNVFFPLDIVTRVPLPTGYISDNIPNNEEAGKRYGEYYQGLDPLKVLALPVNMNKPFTTTDVVDLDEYVKSEFYLDFFKPLGIFWVIGFQAWFNGRSVGGFGMHRGVDDKRFTERDKAILAHFAPLVGFALYNNELKEKMSANLEKDLVSHPSFGFTPREEEVAMLLTQGLKNSEIAEKLFISVHTVKGHLKSMFQKTETDSRSALISLLFISSRAK